MNKAMLSEEEKTVKTVKEAKEVEVKKGSGMRIMTKKKNNTQMSLAIRSRSRKKH